MSVQYVTGAPIYLRVLQCYAVTIYGNPASWDVRNQKGMPIVTAVTFPEDALDGFFVASVLFPARSVSHD
ncbi:hypothetical protein LCGC14_2206870 [marine sediment metagenome]|uniref:Uncharacterized protein n=1 Tax=marine sediment metagenome TaxID=412755 RepID=A0A0F9E2G1_9ZZZZ